MSILNDETTMGEMLTFVRDEHYKPTAEDGAHDDCVMALAIAHHIRPQQSYLVETVPEETVAWDESMWEDYNNASPEQQQYLIKSGGGRSSEPRVNPKNRSSRGEGPEGGGFPGKERGDQGPDHQP